MEERKFLQERDGAGMGDGAGITGRGRGIGSPPQTRPIAIPNLGCFCKITGFYSSTKLKAGFIGFGSNAKRGWKLGQFRIQISRQKGELIDNKFT